MNMKFITTATNKRQHCQAHSPVDNNVNNVQYVFASNKNINIVQIRCKIAQKNIYMWISAFYILFCRFLAEPYMIDRYVPENHRFSSLFQRFNEFNSTNFIVVFQNSAFVWKQEWVQSVISMFSRT